jgi:serine/threonine protein kinase
VSLCASVSRYRVLRLVGEGTFSQLVVAEDTFAPSPPSQHHLAGMYGSATCNEAPHTSSLQHSAPPGGQQVIPRHRLVALKIMNSKYAFIGVQELDKLYTLNQRDQRSWCPIVRVQGPGAFYFQTHLVIVLELLGPALLAYMKTLPRGRVPVEQLRKIALQLVLALGYVSTAGMIHGDIKPEVRIDTHAKAAAALRTLAATCCAVVWPLCDLLTTTNVFHCACYLLSWLPERAVRAQRPRCQS